VVQKYGKDYIDVLIVIIYISDENETVHSFLKSAILFRCEGVFSVVQNLVNKNNNMDYNDINSLKSNI
jgi:hypothetical protein